uniref:hypothetical protein n=3 Tax=Escherichia coli TaxID=562 RepID=UPI000668F0EC
SVKQLTGSFSGLWGILVMLLVTVIFLYCMFDGVRYILKIYEKYDDVPTSLTLVSLGIKLRQKQYDH